jgi:hypothetical protein
MRYAHHSRSRNGVASLTYGRAYPVRRSTCN